jgi:hypothetical protein
MKVFLLVTAALCIPASGFADEALKFRAITHLTSVQSQDVGDVDGHAMSLVRPSGIAWLPDGSIGATYFTTITDYVKGSGEIVRVYQNVTFEDGSQLWFKTTGSAAVEGTKTDLKGSITVLGGTGRFAGAHYDGCADASPDRLRCRAL